MRTTLAVLLALSTVALASGSVRAIPMRSFVVDTEYRAHQEEMERHRWYREREHRHFEHRERHEHPAYR